MMKIKFIATTVCLLVATLSQNAMAGADPLFVTEAKDGSQVAIVLSKVNRFALLGDSIIFAMDDGESESIQFHTSKESKSEFSRLLRSFPSN